MNQSVKTTKYIIDKHKEDLAMRRVLTMSGVVCIAQKKQYVMTSYNTHSINGQFVIMLESGSFGSWRNLFGLEDYRLY